MKKRLCALAIALSLVVFGIPQHAAAQQQGPCAPYQWALAAQFFNNLPYVSDTDYAQAETNLEGLLNGILPGLGFGCQYEFNSAYMTEGIDYINANCSGQGFACHWLKMHLWAGYYLTYMGSYGG